MPSLFTMIERQKGLTHNKHANTIAQPSQKKSSPYYCKTKEKFLVQCENIKTFENPWLKSLVSALTSSSISEIFWHPCLAKRYRSQI